MSLAASVAAAAAVVSAAGLPVPSTFIVRSQGSLVALYAALAKGAKEDGDKAAVAVYKAAQAAAAAR